MLRNVLIVKLEKLVHCEFICISFSFVHTPVCANCNYSCKLYIFQKKKKKKKKRKTTCTSVWVKIPKLCHNTPLSIFSLGKGGNPYVSNLTQKLSISVLSALSSARERFRQNVDNLHQNCPKYVYFFPTNFAPFQ